MTKDCPIFDRYWYETSLATKTWLNIISCTHNFKHHKGKCIKTSCSSNTLWAGDLLSGFALSTINTQLSTIHTGGNMYQLNHLNNALNAELLQESLNVLGVLSTINNQRPTPGSNICINWITWTFTWYIHHTCRIIARISKFTLSFINSNAQQYQLNHLNTIS